MNMRSSEVANRPPVFARRAQRGFTLLEVLVALIVLSIGLLGLSGLQTTSLRSNHSASLRTQATILSSDILDRIRANRDAAVGTAKSYDIDFAAAAAAASCSADCTDAQVAASDLFQWRAYVERLPGGEGSVSVATDGAVEVQIRWNDTRDNTAKQTFTTRTMI